MSGLGAGISALVNGFVGGRDIRNRWEDRKDEKEWQKKLREYRANAEKRLDDRHAWAGEEMGWQRDRHGVYMDTADRTQKQWDQTWADDQAMRDALSGAVDAADAGTIQPADDSATVSTKNPSTGMGVAPDVPALSEDGKAAAATISEASPVVQFPEAQQAPAPRRAPSPTEMGAAPEPAAAGAFLQDLGDGTVIATRAPRNAAEQAQLAQAAKEGRLAQDPEAARRQAEIDRIGTARATANGAQRAMLADPDHEYGKPGGAGADLAQGAKAVARGAADVVDGAVNQGLKGVRQINRVINPAAKWVTGNDFGEPRNVDWSGGARDEMPAPPKGATKAEAATAEGTAKVMDAMGDDPAMQAAAEGTPLGVKPGQSMTVKQRDNAATTFMDSYRKNGVPIIQKELMRQGKFAEAQALTGFVNDQAAQEGMRNWSRGVFAAMNGDLETAAEAMMDAYNSAGYFDDGYEILKDQSSLIKDENGDVSGVRLAMRNQQTGEVTVQEDSISDVITKGLWLTSPEKAMETYIANQQAIQKQLLEADAARREQAGKLVEKDFDATNDAALELMKASIGLDGKPTITYEEALAEVQRARSGGGSAQLGGDTPVLRRPG